jgi:hypothetical protein
VIEWADTGWLWVALLVAACAVWTVGTAKGRW